MKPKVGKDLDGEIKLQEATDRSWLIRVILGMSFAAVAASAGYDAFWNGGDFVHVQAT